MKKLNIRQGIETKFLAPTNHRGSRVKASYAGGSIEFEWDTELDLDENHYQAAEYLAKKLNWKYSRLQGCSVRGLKHGYVFVLIQEDEK